MSTLSKEADETDDGSHLKTIGNPLDMDEAAAESESRERPTRWWLRLAIAVIFVSIAAFSLADAIGFFNTKGYTAVTHGSHVHYVPDDRDPKVGLSRFPTQKPGPDEYISPTGQVLKKEAAQ